MLVVNLGRKPTGAQERLHFDFPVDRLPLRSAAMAKSKVPPLQINNEAIARLKGLLSDPFYKDAIENSASYNTRVCLERKMRLPFLDAQTGVAQSDCHLWMQKWQRMPGLADGQLYTYPAKRWRKKRRQYLMNDRYLARRIRESDVNEADIHQISVVENAAARLEDGDSTDKMVTEDVASKDSWYQEYEDVNEIANIPDIDDPDTDFEDYEELYTARKKKKKPPKSGVKRQRIEYTDAEKPYSCEICGTRYKTRPGLSYHYSHSHNNSLTASSANKDSNKDTGKDKDKDNSKDSNTNSSSSSSSSTGNTLIPTPIHQMSGGNTQMDPDADDPMGYMTPKASMNPMMHPQQMGVPTSGVHMVPPPMHHMGGPMAQPLAPMNPQTSMHCPPPQHQQLVMQNPSSSRNSMANQPDDPLAGLRKFQDSFLSFLKTPSNGQKSASGKPLATPSPYCDFCLGDNSENKKTKAAEELVSCADCGRSAHPTCLQFTPNMTLSVKKYRWQCIECKSCGLCGTSDNDDQLLFCDDCDRGYHMYCLTPPLSEPPEGSWSCHLCVEEYGGRK